MTSAEMITNFKIGYDIINLEVPGYEDSEILVFLNQAQIIELTKEISLRRWTFISNIIENTTYNTSVGTFQYTRVVTPTANDYIAYINSKSKITRATFKMIAVADWVDNIFIRKEDSGKYISNSNNYPILLNPRVFEEINGTIGVIYDRNTTFSGANDFVLEYVRRPVDITAGVDCEINTILHERIVNTAVDLAKKPFNPQEAVISQQADTIMTNPKI